MHTPLPVALFSRVHTRGTAPESFLRELIAWGRSEDAEVFAANDTFDIYNVVSGTLGPWESALHRRAVMLEVLRVLAGFESSWNWSEDYDRTNPREDNDLTKSAGICQCSADSMVLRPSLRDYAQRHGIGSATAFRRVMVQDHLFAIGYTARLLRVTTRHHGPVRDRHILPWLRRDAVRAFVSVLE